MAFRSQFEAACARHGELDGRTNPVEPSESGEGHATSASGAGRS